MVLITRHVNMMIIQVILMVAQETWDMNIRMKKMTNTLDLHMKKLIRIKSKTSEEITEEDVIISLSEKIISRKVIKSVMFTIDNHKMIYLSVGYQNKIVQTKDKRNHLNIMHIQYLLGTNNRLPLTHMAKIYIWLEETKK